MTPAGKAELWRMVSLALNLLVLPAVWLHHRGAAALALALAFLAGERWRWWVNRKWDAIEAERAVLMTGAKRCSGCGLSPPRTFEGACTVCGYGHK